MISANNVAYWLCHPLDPNYIRVLERVRDGVQPFHNNRFEVAYLISLECVEADCENKTLAITEKGEEAIEFYDPAQKRK